MRIVELTQDTEAWLQWRRKGFGASDSALIYKGKHFERTFDDLVAELLSASAAERVRKSNWAMQQGKDFEPRARDYYERTYGVEARPICVVSDEYDWLRASLDGYVHPPIGPTILEIKYAKREWHEMALDGVVPPDYEPQLCHQALATGCPDIHYLSGNPRFPAKQQLAVVPYRADPALMAELLRRMLVLRAAVDAGEIITFSDLIAPTPPDAKSSQD